MPWLRSWTSRSFVHAFNSIAPTTVCQAYSHRNKSVDKFRCSYLPKTSRIQPLVLPPGSNSASYITCFIGYHAFTLVPLLPLLSTAAAVACVKCSQVMALTLKTLHCSSAKSPSPTALCGLASTSSLTSLWFWPGHTDPLVYLLRHTRPSPTSGLYTCWVSKAVFPRCLCGWPATPAVFSLACHLTEVISHLLI